MAWWPLEVFPAPRLPHAGSGGSRRWVLCVAKTPERPRQRRRLLRRRGGPAWTRPGAARGGGGGGGAGARAGAAAERGSCHPRLETQHKIPPGEREQINAIDLSTTFAGSCFSVN